MKTLFLLLTISIISGLDMGFITLRNHNHRFYNFIEQDSFNYKVYKIDSINNYYLIYAKKESSFFKIVSKKNSMKNCSRIKIGKFYKFRLNSMLFVNGQRVIPINQIYEISGWRVDKFTTINFEGDSIRNLYTADNIKGLCFMKNKKGNK